MTRPYSKGECITDNNDHLFEAIKKGCLDEIKRLIKPDPALVHCRDKYGNTPLMIAANFPYLPTVELLLNAGADVNAENSGSTALIVASMFERPHIVRLLLSKKPKIDAQDKKGETALHNAIKYGNESVAIILLEAGARIDILNNDGFTALDIAKQKGRTRIIEKMMEIQAAGGIAAPEKTNKNPPTKTKKSKSGGTINPESPSAGAQFRRTAETRSSACSRNPNVGRTLKL
ncbi:MAG: ankyrin repeat domain-containing protein [Thaumarchaeota archaeon]|nr:ankyrin repeat domain-containing protein [Nitrososphaerota archaeon]